MAKYIVGNWKMNLLEQESVALAQAIVEATRSISKTEAWIAPSFLSIPAVSKVTAGSRVKVGTQTVHGEPKGTFTGEVSCAMLKDFGCTFSLIGHSERRWVLGETDAVVAKKAAGALAQGILPIFCLGESIEERKAGRTKEIIQSQLSALFEAIPKSSLKDTILAYEPRWAISDGTVGTVATPQMIEEAHDIVYKVCLDATGSAPRAILYGGSATDKNISEIISIPHVDGALVGGASLKAESFNKMIELAEAFS